MNLKIVLKYCLYAFEYASNMHIKIIYVEVNSTKKTLSKMYHFSNII